jgi:hypothetical protein
MAIAVVTHEEPTGRRCPTLASCRQELRGAVALIVVCTIVALFGIVIL